MSKTFWQTEWEMMIDDIVCEAGELLARHGVVAYSEGHFVRTDHTILPEKEAAKVRAELDEIMIPLTPNRLSITARRDMLVDAVIRRTPKGEKSEVARRLVDELGLPNDPASLRTRSYRKR